MRSWQWPTWGTTATLVVTDDAALGATRRLVERAVAHAERAADLHNPRSEVSRLAGAAGRPRRVGSLLAAFLGVHLAFARATDGLLDPTVGAAVIRARAARRPARKDLSWLPGCGGLGVPAPRDADQAVPGWRSVELDDRTVRMPAGTLLDLGALGRAATARYCADLVWNRLGTGVLVDLGGDVATAGPGPRAGWPTRPGAAGEAWAGVRLPGWAGLATVSSAAIDPRTGRPTPQVWRRIGVAPGGPVSGLVEAKALAVAAAVLGEDAPAWLARREVTAMLTAGDGNVLRIGEPLGDGAPVPEAATT